MGAHAKEAPMSKTHRFQLSSEECELLLAFEEQASLSSLARSLGKDATVISKKLQKLAGSHPVLEKARGRWQITEAGRKLNSWTRSALRTQAETLDLRSDRAVADLPSIDDRTLLLLVNVQKGVNSAEYGPRNNLQAEENIVKLLESWRQNQRPVCFAQHQSAQKSSPLKPGSKGAEPKEGISPRKGETVITKSANSAFVGTPLGKIVKTKRYTSIVVAGFCTNFCVDATARSAGDLGFTCYVVSDATATFDLVEANGKRLKAEDLHSITLASLGQEFARITHTQALLSASMPATQNLRR
jgi:nicotinamidase-related amidase